MRFIIYVILFYLVYRLIKVVIRIINGSYQPNDRNINYSEKNNNRKNNYNIQKKDIVDADFKEIKGDEEKKT
jgi:hypothetical protein